MEDKKNLRKVLQNEGLFGGAVGTASNYTCSNKPFATYNWLGFLSSIKVLDTTILKNWD